MGEENNASGIEVICAGLGRTGTYSLTDALTTLGYKPYHYVAVDHHQEWADFAEGKRSSDEIIDLVVNDGYNVTLDNPCCDIYTDILKKYPKAKVVLSVRDRPEAFVKSWKVLFDTMVITEQRFSWKFPCFFGYIPLFSNLKKVRYFMGTTHLGLSPGELTHQWRKKNDDWLIEQYKRHNDHIKEHVDKDQLLVYNVKEGWEPLCQFLGKDIPQEPFPHSNVNTTKSLKKMRSHFLMVVYGWIPTTLAITIGVAALYLGKVSDSSTRRSSSSEL